MNCCEAPLVISVPWPIRFFGDFQYFLGLPALVAGVDLRTAISAQKRDDELFSVKGPWNAAPIICDPRGGDIEEPSLRRVVKVLSTKGLLPDGGYNFEIATRVHWPRTLADSPAMAAAWTVSLLELGGRLSGMSGKDVAALAAQAFAQEQPSARPVPEIYAAILGGTLLVTQAETPEVMAFERNMPGIITCSLPSKKLHQDKRPETSLHVLSALAEVVKMFPSFDVRSAELDDIVPQMANMDDRISTIVYAQIVMRDLCRSAHKILENEYGFDDDRLGEMLDGEHEMLRDYLGYNDPEIESMIETAVGGGALGGKIMPESPGLVLFAPTREDEVAKTMRQAGIEAHITPVSDGMRVEHVHKGEAHSH